VQAAGCIQKDKIVAVFLRVLHRGLGNVHRVRLPHLKHGDIQLFAHRFQLLDGSGAVDVAGGQQRALALLAHVRGQLCAVGGLAGALKAHQHDYAWGFGGDVELLVFAAHKGAQLLVDYLYYHLGR